MPKLSQEAMEARRGRIEEAARSKAASSASVKRLIAETTTTTAFDRRSERTSAATRSKARASSTDVPPNFITVACVFVVKV